MPTGSPRASIPSLPVIVLSGRGADADRVRGLDFGADDYVVKPFHYQELRARIGAVLRRGAERREGPCRVGEIVVDPSRRKAWVGEREVALSNKEFGLLRVLAGDPLAGLHQARAARGGLGLPQPRLVRARSTRTPAGCGANSTPSTVATWSTAGAYGYRLIDG